MAAHYYNIYETSDGKFISIGSIEQFYEELRERVGLTDKDFDQQHEPAGWPDLKEKLAAVFKTKTRDEWDEILSGTDVLCSCLNIGRSYCIHIIKIGRP